MRSKILIAILILIVFGCSSVKFELADGTKYERWNEQELNDIKISVEKPDGTKIKASMGSQESHPEKLQEILGGISRIMERLNAMDAAAQ